MKNGGTSCCTNGSFISKKNSKNVDLRSNYCSFSILQFFLLDFNLVKQQHYHNNNIQYYIFGTVFYKINFWARFYYNLSSYVFEEKVKLSNHLQAEIFSKMFNRTFVLFYDIWLKPEYQYIQQTVDTSFLQHIHLYGNGCLIFHSDSSQLSFFVSSELVVTFARIAHLVGLYTELDFCNFQLIE